MAAPRRKLVTTLPFLIRNLRKESPKPANQTLPSLRRAFSLYDQINLIDKVPEDQLRFQGYSDTGFTVNGVDYEGSVLVYEKLVMSWSPKKFSEITQESLSIFKILKPVPGKYSPAHSAQPPGHPKPHLVFCISGTLLLNGLCALCTDILLLGCGRYIEPIDPELRRFLRSTGMKLEVIDSRNASSTFNILNEEGRMVAAALLPYGVSS